MFNRNERMRVLQITTAIICVYSIQTQEFVTENATNGFENTTLNDLELFTIEFDESTSLNISNINIEEFNETLIQLEDSINLSNFTETTSTTESEDETATSTTESADITTTDADVSDEPPEIVTNATVEKHELPKCRDGLILRAWKPDTHLMCGDRIARGLVYFLVMCYLFLGTSIVSDRFMAAIETITATEKRVMMRKPDGSTQTVVVRVWNETVANLTLMALGTSAPEILLSIIEIFATNFNAGDLGPGTIVGSAAFNLFAIISLCVFIIPNGEVRRIKHLRVFFVTATWSIFAYIWLYAILAYYSPGEVTIVEGLVTFICFPLTVVTAYIADRRLLVYKYLHKGYHMNERGIVVQSEIESALNTENILPDKYTDLDRTKQEYIEILKDLKRKYPQYDREHLEIMAEEQLLSEVPKSRAFYRIQATRKIVGREDVMKKLTDRRQSESKANIQSYTDVLEDELVSKVYFEPANYHVLENCGEMEIRVVRRGGLSKSVRVDYETEDGSAEANTDYVPTQGTLVFPYGVDEQVIKVGIIDDDTFEQDECFFVRLSNPSNQAILISPKIATVLILDDDHCGIFAFTDETHELNESIGTYELKVQRFSGARGNILLPYWTNDGTAKAARDYEAQNGTLLFKNNECE